jgi:hypothetical protein
MKSMAKKKSGKYIRVNAEWAAPTSTGLMLHALLVSSFAMNENSALRKYGIDFTEGRGNSNFPEGFSCKLLTISLRVADIYM